MIKVPPNPFESVVSNREHMFIVERGTESYELIKRYDGAVPLSRAESITDQYFIIPHERSCESYGCIGSQS